MTNDEINERTETNCQKFMTHKVGHGDGFNNAIVGGRVVCNQLRLLLGDKLRGLFYKRLVIRG